MLGLIDLRSDTATLPTAAMRQAMSEAELGDDTYGEDPTVARLQDSAAERLGVEAGLLCISAHMANLVAAMVHARPGDEVIVDAQAHIFYYETGSLSNVAGLATMPVESIDGVLDPTRVEAAIRDPDVHFPRARLLCLENTHNRSGGRVTPVGRHAELCELARRYGMVVHLDGARLFNAATATGVDASNYARDVDSITISLSKGLSAPLGALLLGGRSFIAEARHARRRLGGGMRQAGVIAAAGIVALDTMVDRLTDDHDIAKRLGRALDDSTGLVIDHRQIETNIVLADHSALGFDTRTLVDALRAGGVVVSPRGETGLRFVTHRHIDADIADEAVLRVSAVLDGLRR